ncbi:MAG: HU family DNA-binding protein [Bacteroidaceae bacterium]|nr:HU family DNA-binding protein [Bacteroidaceae bacterium]
MDKKLNHSDLSTLFSKESALSAAKAELFTKNFFDLIIEGLEKDGIVKINGLGTFKVVDVASRSSVNVNTGEKFEIKGHRKIAFLPADTLKNKVNQPFAMFEPVEISDDYVDTGDSAAEESVEESNEPTSESCEPQTVAAVETVEPENPTESSPAVELKEPVVSEEPVEEVADTPESEPAVTIEATEDSNNEETASEPVTDKEKEAPKAVKQHKKSRMGVTITLISLFVVSLSVVGIYYFIVPKNNMLKRDNLIIQKSLAAINEPAKEAVKEEIIPQYTVVEESVAIDTIQTVEPEEIVEQKAEKQPSEDIFVILPELTTRPLSSITESDTTLYKIVGEIATHRVASNETLTRIALKYYNDKRFWPYIVHYNKMGNHNRLEIGMTLKIPRLVTK